jgi:hypothetical protein
MHGRDKYKILVGKNLTERGHSENLGVDEKIIWNES